MEEKSVSLSDVNPGVMVDTGAVPLCVGSLAVVYVLPVVVVVRFAYAADVRPVEVKVGMPVVVDNLGDITDVSVAEEEEKYSVAIVGDSVKDAVSVDALPVVAINLFVVPVDVPVADVLPVVTVYADIISVIVVFFYSLGLGTSICWFNNYHINNQCS